MTDERLHQAFDDLRRSEGMQAPRFERLWKPRPARRHSKLAAAVLLVAVMLTAIAVHRPEPQPSISTWRAPTDFLLRTPGQELLGSLPDLKGNAE